MADPLSVAASVTGLIAAAAKISNVLYTVVNKARNAPDDCRKIRNELDDIRNVLAQLQVFIMGAKRPSASRAALIMVDQVVVTLAACVTTFSELDAFAEGLRNDAEMRILDRLRWSTKESDIRLILSRLEAHKASVTLMLSILTCQKQIDAEDKVDALCSLVQSVLEQNSVLAQRLNTFEAWQHDLPRLPGAAFSVASVRDVDFSVDMPEEQHQWQRNSRGFAFEELLMNSRAYRTAAKNNSDAFSAISSAGRTASWSMLSGLSLSEISHIAILALPIYSTDLNNKEDYSFAPTTRDPMAQPLLPTDTSSNSEGEAPISSRRAWLKNLIRSNRPKETVIESESESQEQEQKIFGVPIRTSIPYANAALSLIDEDGNPYVYGYVSIIVAKSGVFLKERGTDTEHIFATNGNPVRVKQLQDLFEAPPRYGKGLEWDPFTVYDCATVLLRYLKSLPEPIVPYYLYGSFIDRMRPHITWQLDSPEPDIDGDALLPIAQDLIKKLPPLNRHLLLYLLDLLAVFAAKSDTNKMTTLRLTNSFQPCFLSGTPEQMDADAHELASWIVVFLIDNQDYFLLGINSAGTD